MAGYFFLNEVKIFNLFVLFFFSKMQFYDKSPHTMEGPAAGLEGCNAMNHAECL